MPQGDHLLRAAAFDGQGARLYHGEAIISVDGGRRLLVLLQLLPEQPSGDHAPYIESLSVSSLTADFGRTLTLAATVGDPDPADVPRLLFSWRATAGTFVGSTDRLNAVWQAPQGPQPLVVTITFTVTDPSGLSATVALDIGVRTGNSGATVATVVNTFPRIDHLVANATVASVGGVFTISSSAHDPDGDALHHRWSSVDCPGVFLSPINVPNTQFQLGALPTGATCKLLLTVDDGRGGMDQATIGLSAGPAGTEALPIIASAVNGGAQGFTGRSFALTIEAYDPVDAGAPLKFDWESSGVTIDGIASGPLQSTLAAHVASCSGPASATVSISRSSSAAEVKYRFEILTCAPSCRELKMATATLNDGTYLVDPDGPAGSAPPVTVYCDMSTDTGGWTFVAHVAADATGYQLFDRATGTYLPSRSGGATYSLGVLPFLEDTEMMVTVDTANPRDALAAQSLVTFQYLPGHQNFNWGPGPCTSIRPFGYRTAPFGPYVESSSWACTGLGWGTRNASDTADLIQFGGPGVFLGGALGSSGLDRGWGHEAWIYVR
ncbi:MAG TPA: fibrinogen-like YCDxxxxGGGW domain-containing protein [Myxococcaceae bacterium]|nr:fibrinogen-like YCDxxxxGGGW domain-containing protein [Myxococcaceae bacterium]